jgi:hypothetical protein
MKYLVIVNQILKLEHTRVKHHKYINHGWKKIVEMNYNTVHKQLKKDIFC